jgi:hypothetical protein
MLLPMNERLQYMKREDESDVIEKKYRTESQITAKWSMHLWGKNLWMACCLKLSFGIWGRTVA